MRINLLSVVGICLLLANGAVAAKAEVFGFEDQSVGTPFTSTVGGLTATFDATGELAPGYPGFAILNTSELNFAPFSGNYLITNTGWNDEIPNRNLGIMVTLDKLVSSVNLAFSTSAQTPGASLTLIPYLNGTALDPFTVAATQVGDNYTYGTLDFSGLNFDSFLLQASTDYFAIDTVSLTPTDNLSGVPEPAPTALVIFGIAGLLGFIRHQRERKFA